MTAPFTGGRGRSAAVTSRDSRMMDQRQAASAQMLFTDAVEVASGGKEGLALAKQMITHAATGGAHPGMSNANRAATGVGIAVAAAVGIAGIVLTGGLALPLLVGIGAGAYALKAMIKEIGTDMSRQNRNWLARYNGAAMADSREQATLLSCEAGDALRRAVDHYRIMKNTIIPLELKKYEDINEYKTCEDAINHVKAVARFIHHGDKVRNYVLPCIDTCIFYLEQYKLMNDTWNSWEPSFRRGLELWFMEHPSGACSAVETDLCYAPRPGGALPMRPYDRNKTGWRLPIGAAAPDTGAIEIGELIEAMKFGREKIYQGMHVLSGGTASYNMSSETPSMTRTRAGSPSSDHMARARMQLLVDAVWQQVDRPNYYNRTTRRISHWYTRNNKTEKAAAVMATVTDIGSLFVPFLKGVDTISDFAKDAIKAGISAGVAGISAGMGALMAEGRPPMSSAMLSQTYAQEKAKTDVRGTGAAIEKLMPDLLKHFGFAAQAMKDLQAIGGTNITTCKKAFGLSAQAAELVHEMNKVALLLMPCIGMTDYVAAGAYQWSLDEDEIWLAMEKDVSEWVKNGNHANCREANSICYGAKHHATGGGLFSRTAVTWHVLSESTPHKAM